MIFSNYKYLSIFAVVGFLFLTNIVQAQTGSFSIAPGKLELEIIPGNQVTTEVFITNNLGSDFVFKIDFEDVGPMNGREGFTILNESFSPESLKSYLTTPDQFVEILNGQTLRVPINFSLPKNVSIGSLHGGVFVSPVGLGGDIGQAKISPRLGVLAFVRVIGERLESGLLKEFKSTKKIYKNSESPELLIFFQNSGNTYLNPYGFISGKSLLGDKDIFVEVKPWFVLPQSTRELSVKLDNLDFGFYLLDLKLNNGYDNKISIESVWFFVLPNLLLSIFVILILMIGFVVFLKYFYKK